MFAMWLGEKITDRGIGNGISILIMVGIIARLPQSFAQEFASRVMESNGGMIMILIELVIWFVIILASIMLVRPLGKFQFNMQEELLLVDLTKIKQVQDNIFH